MNRIAQTSLTFPDECCCGQKNEGLHFAKLATTVNYCVLMPARYSPSFSPVLSCSVLLPCNHLYYSALCCAVLTCEVLCAGHQMAFYRPSYFTALNCLGIVAARLGPRKWFPAVRRCSDSPDG
eukprot:scaffold589175_cov20-Prasinocladus_malaysianus.AAC.1